MPRPCSRVRLDDGLKLDINRLAQRGFLQRGAMTGPVGIRWTSNYWGEIASGTISASMCGDWEGWFRISIGELDQRIILVPRPRHFGGRQWYFVCPATNRPVSVLWMPPGARSFRSRQAWGRQVAYVSQFVCSSDRIWRAKAKINSRLCAIGRLDPDEWEFPPKPKWMRWRTYRRYEDRFDRLEERLDAELCIAAARFLRA